MPEEPKSPYTQGLIERRQKQETFPGLTVPGGENGESPYTKSLQSGRARQRLAIATALDGNRNPEIESRVKRVSMQTGLPDEIIRINLDNLEKRLEVGSINVDALMRSSPELARWIMQNDPTPIRDDVANLSGLNWLMKAPIAAMKVGAAQAVVNLLEAGKVHKIPGLDHPFVEEAKTQIDIWMMRRYFGEEGWFEEGIVEFAKFMPQMAGAAVSAGIGAGGAAILGQLGPQVGLPEELITVPGAARAGAFTWSYLQGVGEVSRELTKMSNRGDVYGNPLDPALITSLSIVGGAGIGALEVMGMGAMSRIVPGGKQMMSRIGARKLAERLTTDRTFRMALTNFGKDYFRGVTTETSTEVAQQLVTIMSRHAARKIQGGEWQKETLRENFEEMWDVGLATLKAMSVGGGFLSGGTIYTDMKSARRAGENYSRITAMTDLVGSSKAIERSPESVREIVKVMKTAKGAVQNAYIGFSKWNELATELGVDPAQTLNDIMGEGTFEKLGREGGEGDIVMPIETYLEHVARTEMNDHLTPHVRFAPDDISLADKQVEDEATAKDLDAVFTEAADPKLELDPELEEIHRLEQGAVLQILDDPVAADTIGKVVALMSARRAARAGIGVMDHYQQFEVGYTDMADQLAIEAAGGGVETLRGLAVERVLDGTRRTLTDREKQAAKVARGVAKREEWALKQAAQDMAARIPEGTKRVVPVPDRSGSTTTNRLLADRVASQVGAVVADVLVGEAPSAATEGLLIAEVPIRLQEGIVEEGEGRGEQAERRRGEPRRDAGVPADAGRHGPEPSADAPAYGTASEGSASVRAFHYGRTSRETLTGKYYGNGMPGAERSRVDAATDPRIKQRIYFYSSTGEGVFPESGVGDQAHEVQLNNIYDISSGKLKPKSLSPEDVNAFESAVLDAGFDGWMGKFGRQNAVVLLGPEHTAVPVKQRGPQLRKRPERRRAPTERRVGEERRQQLRLRRAFSEFVEREELRGEAAITRARAAVFGEDVTAEQLVFEEVLAETTPIEERDDVVLIDGTRETGARIAAAQELLPKSKYLAYAQGEMKLSQSINLRRGKETIQRWGLDPESRPTVRQVGIALEKRQRQLYGKINRSDRSEAAEQKIARWMAAEVRWALAHPQDSGAGWYSKRLPAALDVIGGTYSELIDQSAFTDDASPGLKILGNVDNARNFLTALIAISSAGNRVEINWKTAVAAYDEFRKTGTISASRVFPGAKGTGVTIGANVQRLLAMQQQLGAEKLYEFLLEVTTVKDYLKAQRKLGKKPSSPYPADMTIPRAGVLFGPKIGAFYANMMGAEGYLTMDLWWNRTFNRYRGTLVPKAAERSIANLKQELGDPLMDNDEFWIEVERLHVEAKRKGFKNLTKVQAGGTRIWQDQHERLQDEPFNPSDRGFMVRTVMRAHRNLKRSGIKITVADLQAVLWYYEKRLYGELGARQSADISYEEVARSTIAERRSDGHARRQPLPRTGTVVDQGPDGVEYEVVPTEDAEYLDQEAEEEGRIRLSQIEQDPANPSVMYRSVSLGEAVDIQSTKKVAGKGNYFSGDVRNLVFFGEDAHDVIHHGEDVSKAAESNSATSYVMEFAPQAGPAADVEIGFETNVVSLDTLRRVHVVQNGKVVSVLTPEQFRKAKLDGNVNDLPSTVKLAQRQLPFDFNDLLTDNPKFRRFFKGSKVVDEDGKPLILYHETAPERVTSIEDAGFILGPRTAPGAFRASSGDIEAPHGVFMKTSAEEIGVGGGHTTVQIPLVVSMKNPLRVRDRKELGDMLRRRAPAYWRRRELHSATMTAFNVRHNFLNTQMRSEAQRLSEEEGITQPFRRGQPGLERLESLDDEVNRLLKEFEDTETSSADEGRALIVEFLQGEGHDGLILERDESSDGRLTDTYIALKPTQVKHATKNLGNFDKRKRSILKQPGDRGDVLFERGGRKFDIRMFEGRDPSTFLHEQAHVHLEIVRQLATVPNVTQEILADQQVIFDFLGMKSWSDLDVKKQETFAAAFEQYFREGIAPTEELQPIFAKIKAWLLEVYREVKELVKLSSEMRGMFDRMLASEQQITMAQREMGLQPVPGMAEDLDPQARAEYVEARRQAREEAVDKLRAKLMASPHEIKSWFKDERVRIRREVEEDFGRSPRMKALKFLQKGVLLGHDEVPSALLAMPRPGDEKPIPLKLSKQMILDRYGPEVLKKLPRHEYVYAADSKRTIDRRAADPDDLSQALGFKTGAELIEALVSLEGQGYNDHLEEAVQRRLDSEFSDIMQSPSRMAQAALDATVGDKAVEQLVLEVRWLQRQIRRDSPQNRAEPFQQSEFAGKAQEAVEVMSLYELRPHHYRNNAKRHGTAAFNAAKTGNLTKAFDQKLLQLWNITMEREVRKAREEADRSLRLFRRMLKGPAQSRLGRAGESYLEQVNALLSKFELRSASGKAIQRRESLQRFVAERLAEGEDILIDHERLAAMAKTHYRQLQVQEMRTVKNAVENIYKVATLKTKLKDGQQDRDYERGVGEMLGSAIDNIKQTGKWDTDAGKRRRKSTALSRLDALLLRPEEWISRLDGRDANGPWARMVFQPFAAAQKREANLQAKYTMKVKEAFDNLSPERRKILFSEDVFLKTADRTISREAALVVALNWGNLSNRQKLVRGGIGWGVMEPEVVEEILNSLEREDWALVRDVWLTLQSLWPEIEAMEKEVNGVSPKQIDPMPFTREFEDGTSIHLPGGYFPVVFDERSRAGRLQREAGEAAQALFDQRYTRAMTPHGYTIERHESYTDTIETSIDAIPRHLNQAIHDLTHRQALLQANRILTDQRVVNLIYDRMGKPVHDQMMAWIKYIANQRNDTDRTVEIFLRETRMNLTVVAMGLKATTSFQNVANFFNVLEPGIGLRMKYLMMGMRRFITNFSSSVSLTHEISNEMQQRFVNLDRDLRDAAEKGLGIKVGPLSGTQRVRKFARDFALASIRATDMMVAYPAWLGKFYEGTDAGLTEHEAAMSADATIRQTLTAGSPKDLAGIQRGGELMKGLTMFYSWFGTVYMRLRAIGFDVRQTDWKQDRAALIKLPFFLGRIFAFWLIPSLFAEVLSGRGPGRDDDDETVLEWMAWVTAMYPAMSIPVVRDAAKHIEAIQSGQPVFPTQYHAASRVLDDSVRALATIFDEGHDALFDERDFDPKRMGKATADLIGNTFGLPSGQFKITAGYVYDLWAGDEEPEGTGELIMNLLYRKPRRKEKR